MNKKILFTLVAGSDLLSLILNLLLRVYLFVHRPLSNDLENGFVVPTKLIAGLSYITERESNILYYLLLYAVFSGVIALWLRSRIN